MPSVCRWVSDFILKDVTGNQRERTLPSVQSRSQEQRGWRLGPGHTANTPPPATLWSPGISGGGWGQESEHSTPEGGFPWNQADRDLGLTNSLRKKNSESKLDSLAKIKLERFLFLSF